jgi:hypothetical protein
MCSSDKFISLGIGLREIAGGSGKIISWLPKPSFFK